jgi:predicted glycogen debranching enzyme
MIRFDQVVCADLGRAEQLEWIETNGLGGFASSTITGMNTRRYHGLLTAATKPPVGRFLLLSKLEETLVVDGRRYDLSVNQYPGAVYPHGNGYLKEFRLDPFATSVYDVDGVEVEKRVFMAYGQNTTVIEYEIRSHGHECSLEVRPLIAFRDYHGTSHHNDSMNRSVEVEEGQATIRPYEGLPTLHFAHNGGYAESTGDWFYNFEYAREKERGLDFREDLFGPFVLKFAGSRAVVIASTERHQASEAGAMRAKEIERRNEILKLAPSSDPVVQQLTAAADQYIVQRGDLNTVIAGYHWFADWGRDTMISLPGVALMTGRPEIARNILRAFADSADQGMLPNRFPDAGEAPEYNTVDATLWFFEAIRSYLKYTGDQPFVQDALYPKLKDIIDWHIRGTRYGIRATPDGLLQCGEPGVQLTWMDAKIGDWVVTPRTGKPVEIEALWYNALCIMSDFAAKFGDAEAHATYAQMAQSAKQNFASQFWNQGEHCLFDYVNGDERDGAIRPNMIFAVSLPHRMLSPEQEKQVVEVVERELLTPVGLRSLSPRDSRYRPRYEGGVYERDSAYHQGTVWPWLMGPFITAYIKVNGSSEAAKKQAAKWLNGFSAHMADAGLGQISEIADADAPHQPRGCVAQAWSVAELLRAAVEDVYELPVPASIQAAGHASV